MNPSSASYPQTFVHSSPLPGALPGVVPGAMTGEPTGALWSPPLQQPPRDRGTRVAQLPSATVVAHDLERCSHGSRGAHELLGRRHLQCRDLHGDGPVGGTGQETHGGKGAISAGEGG